MVLIGFELDGVLLPEALVVHRAPLEHFRVDFLDVFVEGAQHSDVAF